MAKRRASSSKSAHRPAHQVAKAELEVLACLDRRGRATARELREAMSGYRPMAHGSMLTLLTRLEAKSLVTKDKGPVGKAFVYRVTSQSGPVYRRLLKDLVHRIFDGSSVLLVSSLFESKPPSRDELNALQKLLDEQRKKTSRKAGA